VISPARIAAYDALRSISSGNSDLPAALAAVRPHLSDERDRALTTDLVTGVLRWQNQLDYLISHFAKRPLSKLDADVVQILRIGTYQLLHLDRIPASAAVNDAVAMTKRAKKSSAAGLVNAVLRAVSRADAHSLPLPGLDARLDYLNVSLSHPRWLAARWLERLGFDDAVAWERFNNAPAPLTLRVNRLRTNVDDVKTALASHGVEVRPARYAPDGLVVVAGNPLRTPLAHTGLFFVQDEASQLVSLLATPQSGDTVLDACASPGGKTTALAAQAHDAALIIAADVRDARMQLLRETVSVSGARRVRLLQADLKEGLPFNESFDIVLVDAPCSGLGTIRRDPDIRWRRREEHLANFQTSQLTMLRNAARAVKPGGRLIYSTCSSEPEENDDVVTRFLSDGTNTEPPWFAPVDMRDHSPILKPVLDERGFLRTSPSSHGLEAFFGAVLRRQAR
jgi:16S rRNA (cytosine967-C5)-methyltransferase